MAVEVWVYALLSVLFIGAVSLVSIAALILKKKSLEKISFLLLAFAAGALFGDAFIHIIPEAFEEAESALAISLYVIAGILIFFVFEKVLRLGHHHHDTEHQNKEGYNAIHPIGWLSLFGDALHNFFDGLTVGVSYLVSLPVGIATTIAIVLHEIPQELGDFAILIKSGFTTKQALFYNFIVALTAVLGAIISLYLGSQFSQYAAIMLPLTAGGFIYIAGSGLIPHLHDETELKNSILQFLAMVLGVIVMASLTLIE